MNCPTDCPIGGQKPRKSPKALTRAQLIELGIDPDAYAGHPSLPSLPADGEAQMNGSLPAGDPYQGDPGDETDRRNAHHEGADL